MANWLTKALTSMRHVGGLNSVLFPIKRQTIDYAKEIGNPVDASVVMAPILWLQRSISEARFRVVVLNEDEREEDHTHELTKLIKNPNSFYSDEHLWRATILSYRLSGNAYWLKVRNRMGRVVELWWVPPWTMMPRYPQDGSEFISHYDYMPGGEVIRYAPEDVVHFRDGVDPREPRLGLSCLSGVMREIFTDVEASNFVASLLKNMGVPGVVISPEGTATPSPENAEAIKTWFGRAFGGNKRGEPLVMSGATKIDQFGFNPQQMDLSPTRNTAEERVCAVMGIPAAVVGFGSGLEATKVGATMTEMRKLAWTNGMLPVLRDFAGEISRSLLPDFEQRSVKQVRECEFDTSDVMALQDDLDKTASRWDSMVRGGWVTVAEARIALGLDVDESHNIYLRPFSSLEIPAGSAPRSIDPPEPDEPKQLKFTSRNPADRAQRGFVDAMVRAERELTSVAEKRFGKVFRDLAAAAKKAVEENELIDFGKSRAVSEFKNDELIAAQILEEMGIGEHQKALKQVYERFYLQVAEKVADASKLIGLAGNLPDPVAQTVIAAGGRRAGLVDLEKQSRNQIFAALAEGRAEGEGVAKLASRISDAVGSGPWTSAEQRSITIARTETKYAQNQSTLAIGKHAGAGRFIIFDGRFGEPRSTPSHIARDGTIVNAQEAEQIAAEEHPNGTLSFAPHFDPED